MEEAQLVMQAISTVGFPIVSFFAVAFLWYRETQMHKEETQKFVEALNNNTLVMEQIKEVLTNGDRKQ